MNTPLTDKNIAAWNDQPLDNYHDIIVSFDYARYNEVVPPTGGFAVVFFDSIVDMPHNGGPGYALGYLPSSDTDYCKLDGYKGLEAAYLAVGFDRYGFFATKTDCVGGLTSNYYPNSFTVRGGVEDGYSLLYNSPDIFYLNPALSGYTVDQRINNADEIKFRSVRIILGKAATEIKIQVKLHDSDIDFIDIGAVQLPFNHRTALKVALTNTTLDPYTNMLVKNFNVAGFPGDTTTRILSGCTQTLHMQNYSKGTFLPMNNEFITTSTGNNLLTFTTDTTRYFLKNINYSGNGIDILGHKDNFVLAKNTNANVLLIYKYLGEKLVRTYSLITPCGSEPLSSDIHNNTLVVCTSALSGSIYFYNYITDSADPTAIGTWNIYQTLLADGAPSGSGLGTSCSLYGDNLLVGNENQLVHACQRNSAGQWEFLQTISDPVTGITKFGRKVSVYGRDAIISAPYSEKEKFNNPGQGEVYHYYLYGATNNWSRVMSIGNFYSINTPAGNFGTSIFLNENTLIVGSPGEMYLNDITSSVEDVPNVGRAYLFNKTTEGLFTQASVLYPDANLREKYMFFGQGVGIYGNYAAVLAAYTNQYSKSNVTVYDTTCRFDLPPLHLPIPECAMALSDGSGFVISSDNDTYVLTLSCVLGLT